MICLHDVKNDEGIKNFFMEMYETYIKVTYTNIYNLLIKHKFGATLPHSNFDMGSTKAKFSFVCNLFWGLK